MAARTRRKFTRCPSTHKVRFRTPNDAKEALRSIRRLREMEEQAGQDVTRRETRWYECACGAYHLTSQVAFPAERLGLYRPVVGWRGIGSPIEGMARIAAAHKFPGAVA